VAQAVKNYLEMLVLQDENMVHVTHLIFTSTKLEEYFDMPEMPKQRMRQK
jgi:hypothetical protein